MFSFSVGRSKSFGLSRRVTWVMKELYIRHRIHNLAADWVALVKKSSYTLKRGRQSVYGMYQVAWWKECVRNEGEWWGSMKCVGETGRKQGHRTDTATRARMYAALIEKDTVQRRQGKPLYALTNGLRVTSQSNAFLQFEFADFPK